MVKLVTDPRAITDTTALDLSSLVNYSVSSTPTTIKYSDNAGDYVLFTGTGIGRPIAGVAPTHSITGYKLVLQGIVAQTVTGLDLGPGELEFIIARGDRTADQIRIYHGNDEMTGGDYNDQLMAFGGNDDLYGGKGNDYLFGGDGNDHLTGGAGDDSLMGDAGHDVLYGGAGADSLQGGDGSDVLNGGLGRDHLEGGAGIDWFVFSNVNQTSKIADFYSADTIMDFQRGIDHIDLRGIDAKVHVAGNQAFTFIGSKAFTRHEGELHTKTVGGELFVEGDVNGDGKPDFDISVHNLTALSAKDFLL
jgi:Ca2+-binding RTX toxin-like protein